jgi:hypothetical protein
MTTKARISKLEKRVQERPQTPITVIEIIKTFEDGRTETEIVQVGGVKPGPVGLKVCLPDNGRG